MLTLCVRDAALQKEAPLAHLVVLSRFGHVVHAGIVTVLDVVVYARTYTACRAVGHLGCGGCDGAATNHSRVAGLTSHAHGGTLRDRDAFDKDTQKHVAGSITLLI